jgi:acetyl-CoA carboxylase biotin carboxyl carrier protein
MDLIYLKKLLKIIEGTAINEIEIDEGETKIKIVKQSNQQSPVSFSQPFPFPQNIQIPFPVPTPQTDSSAISKSEGTMLLEKKLYEIRSPIVGTFYRAPAPDAESYVKIGQKVSPGTVLCIVEAMKLMNEIESDVSGTIANILIDNAQPVEYNQILFEIQLD